MTHAVSSSGLGNNGLISWTSDDFESLALGLAEVLVTNTGLSLNPEPSVCVTLGTGAVSYTTYQVLRTMMGAVRTNSSPTEDCLDVIIAALGVRVGARPEISRP